MQPTHLAPLYQALRLNSGALAAALGAVAGAALFFLWPADVPWQLGLWPLGIGLILSGLGIPILGPFIAAAGLYFMFGALQIDRAAGFDWNLAARKPHWVVGQVKEINPQTDNPARLTLNLQVSHVYQLPKAEGIREARIGIPANQAKALPDESGEIADLAPGSWVAVPMLAVAPQGPQMPGERDYRLWRYLEPEQLRGYGRGLVERTQPQPLPASTTASLWQQLETTRADISAAVGKAGEGVLAALLVGDQRKITPEVRDAYRATGLTHLLAISGMQLTLVGGGIFWLVRRLLASIPALALRINVKMWAAFLGLGGAGAYTVLAGASVGVVRAFIMLALVLVAVLTGRLRSGLRAWAVAILLILAVSPALVTSAGFQLSVAAVGALLLWSLTESRPAGVLGWLRATILTSIVAGAATAPLVVATFGQLSAVGLAANMAAVPAMALVTWLGMGVLGAHIGGQTAIAQQLAGLMELLVQLVNKWALWLAGWQGSITVESSWWPAVAALSLALFLAVLARRWALTTLGVLGLTALSITIVHFTPAPEVTVLSGGTIGIAGNRLLWAEDLKDAKFLTSQLEIPVTIPTEPTQIADAQFMPPAEAGKFAWAQRKAGAWRVQSLTCARIWQRVDPACLNNGHPAEEPAF